jgi:hypothetical protein
MQTLDATLVLVNNDADVFVATPLDPSETDTSYFDPTPADDATPADADPTGPAPDDAAWWSQESGEEADARQWIADTFDRRWDDYAAIVAAEEAYERGLIFA